MSTGRGGRHALPGALGPSLRRCRCPTAVWSRPRVLLGPRSSEHPPLFLRSLSLVTRVLLLSFRTSQRHATPNVTPGPSMFPRPPIFLWASSAGISRLFTFDPHRYPGTFAVTLFPLMPSPVILDFFSWSSESSEWLYSYVPPLSLGGDAFSVSVSFLET